MSSQIYAVKKDMIILSSSLETWENRPVLFYSFSFNYFLAFLLPFPSPSLCSFSGVGVQGLVPIVHIQYHRDTTPVLHQFFNPRKSDLLGGDEWSSNIRENRRNHKEKMDKLVYKNKTTSAR